VTYSASDILNAYRAVGVAPGETVYVMGNIGNLWAFENPGKDAVLRAHFDALMDLLGPKGTLVCSTSTLNLCNTDIPFDPNETPSSMAGTLSEFIRLQPGAHRSFHPFRSYTAIGYNAERLTKGAPRSAYGPFSPEARMIQENALVVAVGIPTHLATSTVHHCEQTVAVPYRYMKEFMHPVVRNGNTVIEPFYLYVWYRDSDVKRDRCRTIMGHFSERYDIAQAPLGRRAVSSYRSAEFFENTVQLMMQKPYIWCESEPSVRPWQR